MPQRRLTLYSKPGCHLCDDLRAELDDLRAEYGFAVEEIDITTDPVLFEQYRYEIPVLVEDGKRIDLASVRGDRKLT